MPVFAAAVACGAAGNSSAHERGAPFSGAMIEPLVLHHAHLEDEQRLNLFFARRLRESGLAGRHGFEAELEIAWASEDFKFGVEAFVPFASQPAAEGARDAGLGDIEIRPLKYAFANRPDFVVSTATALRLPTGKGALGGDSALGQFLFLDRALGNWYLGANAGIERQIRRERATVLEYGVALAYSFIGETSGLAPARPAQPLVVSPSVELIGERRLRGEGAGERSLRWLPGVAFWWPASGLQVRAGVELPLSGTTEAARVFLLQLGIHRDWGAM